MMTRMSHFHKSLFFANTARLTRLTRNHYESRIVKYYSCTIRPLFEKLQSAVLNVFLSVRKKVAMFTFTLVISNLSKYAKSHNFISTSISILSFIPHIPSSDSTRVWRSWKWQRVT